jgi:flagellar biosynthesis anti-sigma factor FlgM
MKPLSAPTGENAGRKLKFPNRLPIAKLQGNSGGEKMRIDPNQIAQALPESSRASGPSPANADARASAGSPLGEDQAQLSGVHVQVQTLAAQASQLPEIRQEKVNALRQAVLGGSYQPSSTQVAEGLFAHMVVKAA